MLNISNKGLNRSNSKEIINISIIISSVIALLVFSFLFLLTEGALGIMIFSSFMTFVYLLISSYGLYRIFKFCLLNIAGNGIKFKLLRYSLSYLYGFAILLLIYCITAPLAGYEEELIHKRKLLPVFVIESLIFTTLIMVLHDFVFIQIDRNITKLENANLKTKSAEAAILLLKQQIHPHFLFNSLHTIKVLYKDDIQLGEEYLVQLADFLRTTVSNTRAATATIDEELKLFENYLNMQKIRFGDALNWNIKIEDAKYLKSLVPAFSLQPLAENAIKHNYFSKKQPLSITIEQVGNTLVVSNGINKKKYADSSIGTGLMNLSERYQIWSGNEIEIEDDGIMFLVRFKIN